MRKALALSLMTKEVPSTVCRHNIVRLFMLIHIDYVMFIGFGAVAVEAFTDRKEQALIGWHGVVRREPRSGDTVSSRTEHRNVTALTSWLRLTGKEVKQSSTGWRGLPGRAIDGITDGRYGMDGCTHTKTASNGSWWEIHLGYEAQVTKVQVVTRSVESRSYNDNISPFSLSVGNKSCASAQRVTFEQQGKPKEIRCESKGSTVKINGPAPMVLCDVKIRVAAAESWKIISESRVCEGHWWLRDRLGSVLKQDCGNDEGTLDACKYCCLQDKQCAAIDWYAKTKVCLRYHSACTAEQTSSGHDGGSSHAIVGRM
eukprot:TRINITY_DN28024_c0_g1_i2.p1 TRINITY_DN28024_c0_g1~~TRINITY_DN28024_c0_g1_i2.p1  ORF type:complete len:314 (-),score=17.94 TRINITY_DN28024_c0_g1_i2:360-1301(-)